jgi:hypothetical protein
VVEGSLNAVTAIFDLDEDELERRVVDREVGITGAPLVRFGLEERTVEGDGCLEIAHVEGKLDA